MKLWYKDTSSHPIPYLGEGVEEDDEEWNEISSQRWLEGLKDQRSLWSLLSNPLPPNINMSWSESDKEEEEEEEETIEQWSALSDGLPPLT